LTVDFLTGRSQPPAAFIEGLLGSAQMQPIELPDALRVVVDRALELVDALGSREFPRLTAGAIAKDLVEVSELGAFAPAAFVAASLSVVNRLRQPRQIVS
jgi:hypothetical protein